MTWYIRHSQDYDIRNALLSDTVKINSKLRKQYPHEKYSLPSDKLKDNLVPFKGQRKELIDGYLAEIQASLKETLKSRTDLTGDEINDILTVAAVNLRNKYRNLTTEIVYQKYPLFVNDELKKARHTTLKHHGVKGQQWGVRNGPPYPIEDRVLRKGTTLATVQGKYSNLWIPPIISDPFSYALGMAAGTVVKTSANAIKGAIKKNKMLYTYNPNDKNDSDIYEGAFGYMLKNIRHAKRIEKTMYTAVKDLKMPTRKERVDEFKKLYKSEKWGPDMKKQLPELVGYLNQGGLLKQMMNGKVPKKISALDPKSKNEWDALYIAFNFAMEHPEQQKYTKQYIKNMMEKYDAMVDDNNVNVYNDAHDPVIVFKYRSSLQKVGSVKLSDEHITEAFKRVEKKMEKAGKTVAL